MGFLKPEYLISLSLGSKYSTASTISCFHSNLFSFPKQLGIKPQCEKDKEALETTECYLFVVIEECVR